MFVIRSGVKAFNQAALGAITESSFPLPQVAPTLEVRKKKTATKLPSVLYILVYRKCLWKIYPRINAQGSSDYHSFCCVAYV